MLVWEADDLRVACHFGGVFHRAVPRWAEVCHGLMFSIGTH
jgi:hypothetical protein